MRLLCSVIIWRKNNMDDAKTTSIDFEREDIADIVIVVMAIHIRYIRYTRYVKHSTTTFNCTRNIRDSVVCLEFVVIFVRNTERFERLCRCRGTFLK